MREEVKLKIKRIEDIYPLTIVSMRYYPKFVIFNCHSDGTCVSPVQEDEEVNYIVEEWMEEHYESIIYGIGETLVKAFKDYKNRYDNYFKDNS